MTTIIFWTLLTIVGSYAAAILFLSSLNNPHEHMVEPHYTGNSNTDKA